jgi:hypothetical protein
MKKVLTVLGVMAVVCLSARADMDSRTLTAQVIGLATNTANIVMRGQLEAIKVDITAGSTSTVTITSGELTLFSKSGIVADATFLPRGATHTTAGVAITDGKTNDVPFALYSPMPMAGLVTMRVIGEGALQTNTVVSTVVFSK